MKIFTLAAALLLPGLALADIDVTIDHTTVLHTDKVGDNSAGFMQIHNTSATDDVLTGWDCPDAAETKLVDASGTALTSLVIPAGKTVTLSANGPHFQLNSTYFTINWGGAVPCRMSFKNTGDLQVLLYSGPPPGVN